MTAARATAKKPAVAQPAGDNKPKGLLHLKYVRSKICAPFKQKRVIVGLGFTRLNQVIEREDTPSIRGMVAKVPHLVEIIKQAEPAGAAKK